MLNNYFQKPYQPWHLILTDPLTDNHLYLGDVSAALDKQFITSKNIKTVITAAANMQHVRYDDTVNHVVYELLDSKSQQIITILDQVTQLISQQLLKGSVLVHCFAGISRSSTLILAYMMKKMDMTFRQAIEFVRKIKQEICPNYGFEMQLKSYEKVIKHRKYHTRRERQLKTKTSESQKRTKLKNTIMGLPQINIGNHQIFQTKFNFLPKERRSLNTKRAYSRKFFPNQPFKMKEKGNIRQSQNQHLNLNGLNYIKVNDMFQLNKQKITNIQQKRVKLRINCKLKLNVPKN